MESTAVRVKVGKRFVNKPHIEVGISHFDRLPVVGIPLQSTTRKVWRCVAAYWEKHGIVPTVREICLEVGIITSICFYHLSILRQRGYLSHNPQKSRAYVLLIHPGTCYVEERTLSGNTRLNAHGISLTDAVKLWNTRLLEWESPQSIWYHTAGTYSVTVRRRAEVTSPIELVIVDKDGQLLEPARG